MNQFIKLSSLLEYLFDRPEWIHKANDILKGLLKARCLRLSQIAEHMPGSPAASYKSIQRFLASVDLKTILQRFFQEDTPFVIGDPTEIERPQAKKTAYVGQLSDGQTLGFWLLLLATPFRGRAIPFHFITYSSKTIGASLTSRNQEHFRAFAEIKPWLGERPLVLDREFSYLELLQALVVERIHFVIRLKLGFPQVSLTDREGQAVKLLAQPGRTAIYRQLYYKGVVPVNVIGLWRTGFQTPLWVMTDLAPEQGLDIYLQRMKIEESFRDCKDLLGLDRAMNKHQAHMEQMIALALLAYVLGLFFGEALRDVTYAHIPPEEITFTSLLSKPRNIASTSKWYSYSGLFVLLKQKLRVPPRTLTLLQLPVTKAFASLVLGNVRTFV